MDLCTLTLLSFLCVEQQRSRIEHNPTTIEREYKPSKRRKDKPPGCGKASWYGREVAGRKTASGQRFDPRQHTAASWHHPFGTRLRVTNQENGKSVVVLVNDRGPARRLNRIIDLSQAAFAKISRVAKGTTRVCVKEM
jgi:rare lipoprotein A